MRTALNDPVGGLVAQLLLLAALAATVGLDPAAWLVGLGAAAVTAATLAHGLSRHRSHRFGLADRVTLTRASLAVGIAALVADSFARPAPLAVLVLLTAVALALDAVDGWIVRRTNTGSALGARFDGEVDAFLIAVLSVYVARSAGAWVLATGAARYAFLAAGWLWPWLRAPLPPRYWRKVVAATQGVTLMVAAAEVVPRSAMQVALAVALVLLAESFGRDVWWLFRHRRASEPRSRKPHGRARTGVAAALTLVALLLVWAALVVPDDESRLTPGAFARLPLEGVAVIALALVVPPATRRFLAWLVGPLLGLLVIVKVLDMGFLAAFDRPFDPVGDWSYVTTGIETLRDSISRTEANLVVAGVAVLGIALLLLMTLAVLRVTRVAAGHRRFALRAVSALGVVWVLCWVLGAPVASTSAAGLVVDEVRAVQAGIDDHAVFAREIGQDRFHQSPGSRLLTALRGKDVLLLFVESYGKGAVQGSSYAPGVDAVLASGTKRLRAVGFSARSGWLTSSTFGGLSWLAHSTLQAGVWVDSQRRYDQLMRTGRVTLATAFKRAGWRTVADVPSDNRTWPQGTSFYHYDAIYDRRNVGYHGPRYAYASMPDQYVLLALQRLELARSDRPNLFAEVDLVSSHAPWIRIPKLLPWGDVGDGSVYRRQPAGDLTRGELFGDRAAVHAAYGRSIQYTLGAIVSFVQRYGDDDLVLVVLGDHQPAKIVSGEHPSHDVPISVIAHDPAVLRRIAGWGWSDGLRPGPGAPVWPMSAFRDRFLAAFGSAP